MAKRVVVVASGETERAALPNLLSFLAAEGIEIDVRKSPRSGALNVEIVQKIIRAAWFELRTGPRQPDKFVVLVDADGRAPGDARARMDGLTENLKGVPAPVLLAVAKWHLETWFLADEQNLRKYLGGKSLGRVDATDPDSIMSPKLHLRNLLPGPYTSRVAGEISKGIAGQTVMARSPSFGDFVAAVRNGGTR